MYDFSSLREWRTGAAPLGKDLQSLLEKKWGAPVYSWYGKAYLLQHLPTDANTPYNRNERDWRHSNDFKPLIRNGTYLT